MDFDETYYADGSIRAVLRCRDLPAGSYCIISVPSPAVDEMVVRKTCNGSKPGIRYILHSSYPAAQEAALDWAERKIREHRRAA